MWPIILIDLQTEEGVVGRAYLEPYVPKAMKYLVPALHDMGEMLTGQRVAPLEFYRGAQRSLHFVGYAGLVDDRRLRPGHGGMGRAGTGRRRAAGGLLGGSVGPVRHTTATAFG